MIHLAKVIVCKRLKRLWRNREETTKGLKLLKFKEFGRPAAIKKDFETSPCKPLNYRAI